ALIEKLAQMQVVRLKDLPLPRSGLLRRQSEVSRDGCGFTDDRYGSRFAGPAIAIDDETRIVLRNQRRIERVRDPFRDGECPDVPGDVPFEIRLSEAQCPQATWNAATGVIDGDNEHRAAVTAPGQHRH